MSADRDAILRKLGQKMLDEIELLLRRFAEERATLERAAARLVEIDAEVSVLNEERDKLIARGQKAAPAESPVEVLAATV